VDILDHSLDTVTYRVRSSVQHVRCLEQLRKLPVVNFGRIVYNIYTFVFTCSQEELA